MKIRIITLFVLLALLSACAPQAAPAASGPAIEVSNVTLNISNTNMAGMDMGAEVVAYLLIKNNGANADKLIGVTADFGETRIHETVIENDVASMKMIDSVEVPANGTVEFKQGSFHIVVINLKEGLKAGDTGTITLKFEKAGDVTASATLADQ